MIERTNFVDTKHEGMIVSLKKGSYILIFVSMMFNMIIMDSIWPLVLQMVTLHISKYQLTVLIGTVRVSRVLKGNAGEEQPATEIAAWQA